MNTSKKNPPLGRVGCLVVFLLLTGCGPDRAQIAAADNSRCESYGFKPGTEAFANCRMSSDLTRSNQQESRRRDIINSVPDQPFGAPR